MSSGYYPEDECFFVEDAYLYQTPFNLGCLDIYDRILVGLFVVSSLLCGALAFNILKARKNNDNDGEDGINMKMLT